MGRPFSDITLYAPSAHPGDSPEQSEEQFLQNYICDLYVQKMHGYKPPHATRITIQPAYFGIWDRTWRNGSIFAIACAFNPTEFASLDHRCKCQYVLDIVHEATTQLSEEYNWDKSVFERAYREVISDKFLFGIDYPPKKSPNRRNQAHFRIEKTETATLAYIVLQMEGEMRKIKLFEKKNNYWYDCVYVLAKHCKWIDSHTFGIHYAKGPIEIYYSITEDSVFLRKSGLPVKEIDFSELFSFQH